MSLVNGLEKKDKEAEKYKAEASSKSEQVTAISEVVAAKVARIDAERKYEVEAAIVRIMKATKTLQHNDLVAKVTEQLQSRFKPDPQLIKMRIESLIGREYLKRSEDNHCVYQYQA